MDKNMRNAKIFKAFCDSNRLRIIEFFNKHIDKYRSVRYNYFINGG